LPHINLLTADEVRDNPNQAVHIIKTFVFVSYISDPSLGWMDSKEEFSSSVAIFIACIGQQSADCS
jgi:hypothetical protein